MKNKFAFILATILVSTTVQARDYGTGAGDGSALLWIPILAAAALGKKYGMWAGVGAAALGCVFIWYFPLVAAGLVAAGFVLIMIAEMPLLGIPAAGFLLLAGWVVIKKQLS